MPVLQGGVSQGAMQNALFLSPAVHLSPGVFLSLSMLPWCFGEVFVTETVYPFSSLLSFHLCL